VVSLVPIIPTRHANPFDDPPWLFDLKLDGFRGVADTFQGRMLEERKLAATTLAQYWPRLRHNSLSTYERAQ
jgi:hypothetical protein